MQCGAPDNRSHIPRTMSALLGLASCGVLILLPFVHHDTSASPLAPSGRSALMAAPRFGLGMAVSLKAARPRACD